MCSNGEGEIESKKQSGVFLYMVEEKNAEV